MIISQRELQAAFDLEKPYRADWPATLDEELADPMRAALLRILARHPQAGRAYRAPRPIAAVDDTAPHRA